MIWLGKRNTYFRQLGNGETIIGYREGYKQTVYVSSAWPNWVQWIYTNRIPYSTVIGHVERKLIDCKCWGGKLMELCPHKKHWRKELLLCEKEEPMLYPSSKWAQCELCGVSDGTHDKDGDVIKLVLWLGRWKGQTNAERKEDDEITYGKELIVCDECYSGFEKLYDLFHDCADLIMEIEDACKEKTRNNSDPINRKNHPRLTHIADPVL